MDDKKDRARFISRKKSAQMTMQLEHIEEDQKEIRRKKDVLRDTLEQDGNKAQRPAP
jgi:hypothetical protein